MGKKTILAVGVMLAIAIPGTASGHSMSVTGPIAQNTGCFTTGQIRTDTIYTSSSSDRTWVVSGQSASTTDIFVDTVVNWLMYDNATGSLVAESSVAPRYWYVIQNVFVDKQSLTAHTGGTFTLKRRIYNDTQQPECYDVQIAVAYATSI